MGCLLRLVFLLMTIVYFRRAQAYCQRSLGAQREKAMVPEKETAMVPDQLEIGTSNKSTKFTGEVTKLKKRSPKWSEERKQKHSQLMKKYWTELKEEGRTLMITEHKERMRRYWKQYKLDGRTDRQATFKKHSELMKTYWKQLKMKDERRFWERCKQLRRLIRKYWTPDVREEHGVSMRKYWQQYKQEGRSERKETDKVQSEKMKIRWQLQKQGCITEESKKLGKKRKELRASLTGGEKRKGLRERMAEYWMWKDKHRLEREKKEKALKRQAMMYKCTILGKPCKIRGEECYWVCGFDRNQVEMIHNRQQFLKKFTHTDKSKSVSAELMSNSRW